MPENECIPLYESADRVTVGVVDPIVGKRFLAPVENFLSGPGIPATAQVGASDPIDGSNIMAAHCPPGLRALGVSTWSAPVQGEKVGCITEGIVPVTAGENINVGEEVQAGAEGKAVKVAAEGTSQVLETGVIANNNALTWRAVTPKATFKIVIAVAGANTAFKIGVVGKVITVTSATNAGSEATTTAAEVIAAIEESAAASALVQVSNAGASTGAGAVAALAEKEGTDPKEKGLAVGLAVSGATSGNDCYIKLRC